MIVNRDPFCEGSRFFYCELLRNRGRSNPGVSRCGRLEKASPGRGLSEIPGVHGGTRNE